MLLEMRATQTTNMQMKRLRSSSTMTREILTVAWKPLTTPTRLLTSQVEAKRVVVTRVVMITITHQCPGKFPLLRRSLPSAVEEAEWQQTTLKKVMDHLVLIRQGQLFQRSLHLLLLSLQLVVEEVEWQRTAPTKEMDHLVLTRLEQMSRWFLHLLLLYLLLVVEMPVLEPTT